MLEHGGPVELRIAGRTLRGVIPYETRATDRAERFAAGVFVSGLDTARINLQHDPAVVVAEQPHTLTLTDSPQALELRAELKPGAALSLLRRGRLTGLSPEFIAIDEHRADGVRVIDRAHLAGIGLVDSSSYPTTVELRQGADWWLSAQVPYNRRMECTCQGGACDSVEFSPGAFDDLQDRNVVAIGGQGFNSVLGSKRRGNLILRFRDKMMQVGLTDRDTEAAKLVAENAKGAAVLVRPMIDLDGSEFIDEGPVRKFSRAEVTALLVKASPYDKGHIPATVDGLETRNRINRDMYRWL